MTQDESGYEFLNRRHWNFLWNPEG